METSFVVRLSYLLALRAALISLRSPVAGAESYVPALPLLLLPSVLLTFHKQFLQGECREEEEEGELAEIYNSHLPNLS